MRAFNPPTLKAPPEMAPPAKTRAILGLSLEKSGSDFSTSVIPIDDALRHTERISACKEILDSFLAYEKFFIFIFYFIS